jgi:hypothetical protein
MWAGSVSDDLEQQLYDETEKSIRILHENQAGSHVRSHTDTKSVDSFLITPPPPPPLHDRSQAAASGSSSSRLLASQHWQGDGNDTQLFLDELSWTKHHQVPKKTPGNNAILESGVSLWPDWHHHQMQGSLKPDHVASSHICVDEKLDQELRKEVIELNLGTTHKLQIPAVKSLEQHSPTDVLDKVDQEGTIIKKVKDGSIQTDDDDDTAAKSTAADGITCIVKSETQCTQTEEEEQEHCLRSWVHSLRQEVMMKSDDVLLCEEEVDTRITMLENRYTSSSWTHVNENLPRKLQIQLHHDQNPGSSGEEGNPTAGGHGILETSSVTAPQTDGLENRELHFSHDHASVHSSTKANLDCKQEKTVAQISSSSSKKLELQETEVNSMQSPKRIVTWERSQISGSPENIDKDLGLKTQNTIHQDRDAAQACELQLMSLSAQLEAGSSTNLKDINILPAAVQDLSELLSIHENTVRERFKQKRHEQQQHTRSLKLADEKTPLKVQSFSSSGSSSVQGKNNNRLHIIISSSSSSSSSRSSNLQSMSECQVVATPGNNKAVKNNPIGNLLQTKHDRLQQDVNTDNNSSTTQRLGDKGSQFPGEQKPGSKVSIKVLSSCDINKVMIMPKDTSDHMSPHGQEAEMGSGAAHAVAVVATAAKVSDSSPTGSSTSSKDSSALYKACSFEQEDEADEEGADEAEEEEAQDGTTYSEESCCNMVLRAPSIRSAAAGLGIDLMQLNLHPEPISFINAAAAERVQPGDHHHGDEADEDDEEDQVISEWGIKSEQGSYSPTDDDTAATVDMCTTAAAAVHGETVCSFNLGKDQPNASK